MSSRRAVVRIILAMAVLAVVAPAAEARGPVVPILECLYINGDGTYTAAFGYKNTNSYAVDIAKGWRNRFSPSPSDRGQPVRFEPGRHRAAVVVRLPSLQLLNWTLDGRYSMANIDLVSGCGRMVGGRVRAFWTRPTDDGGRRNFGLKTTFILPCLGLDGALDLEWAETGEPANRFVLSYGAGLCQDKGGFSPGMPTVGFDTHTGVAWGTLDGAPGARLDWTLEDHGERTDHRHLGRGLDWVRFVVRDPSGHVVLDRRVLVGEGNIDAEA